MTLQNSANSVARLFIGNVIEESAKGSCLPNGSARHYFICILK
jgi:hypothetical protein